MKRTATAAGKVWRIQKHACPIDHPGYMDAHVVTRRWSLATGRRSREPLIVAKSSNTRRQLQPIVFISEVGAMRATSLTERGGVVGQHALTPPPKNARPITREERDIEDPCSIFLRIFKRQQFVEVFGSGHAKNGSRPSHRRRITKKCGGFR